MQSTTTTLVRMAALCLAFAAAACAPLKVTPEIRAAVAAPDRSGADRKTDERRHPEKLLAFAGVRPGMKVLDLGAGAGYSTELLARAVGVSGMVYGQNSQKALDVQVKGRFDARFDKFALKNVVKVARPDDDPVPPGAAPFDLITIFFAYHDLAGAGANRALLLRRCYDALKPGGVMVIADHAARTGAGISVTTTLHRIEESVVMKDFTDAGFHYDGHADFLRNPDDPRDKIVFRSPIKVDEFVLRFVKPM
jgi:predicted methyltransferase